MINKRIAVLLAGYNGSKWISAQVESIEFQKDVDVDIYISLDVSSDNSKEIIESLADKFNNIHLLDYGMRFGGAAPNFFHLLRTVSFSEYDYIALSDQDDIWLSQKLLRAVTVLADNNADGYSSDVIAFWPNGRERLIKKSYPQRKYDHYFEGPGPGCTFVLSKSLAISLQSHISIFTDKMTAIDWHDWFIYVYARHNGFVWVIDDVPLMRYRQHTSNQLGANAGLKPFIKRIKSVINGYAIHQARANVSTFDSSNPFVNIWKDDGRKGIVYILRESINCRRKNTDVLFFVLSCLCMLILSRTWKH